MNGFDIYKRLGFEGFKPISELMDSVDVVPDKKGIYMVLRGATSAYPYSLFLLTCNSIAFLNFSSILSIIWFSVSLLFTTLFEIL